MNFKEIFNAWIVSFNPSEKQKKHAEERYKICLECPSRKTIVFEMCSECGCPIGKKIFSGEFNPCALKKWEEIDTPYLKTNKTLV